MAVTLTNQQALSADKALGALIVIHRPMMGAQKIRRIVRALATHLGDFEALRQSLLQDYGAKNEDGSLKWYDNGHAVFVDDAAAAAFAKDFAELLLVTFEVPEVLVAKDFGPLTPDGTDWLHEEQAPTPEQLIALGPLYEDTEEAK